MSSFQPSRSMQQELTIAISGLKQLTNSQLREILRRQGLPISGVKNLLTTRLTDYLHSLVRDNNLAVFSHIANEISPNRHPPISGPVASTPVKNPQNQNQSQVKFTAPTLQNNNSLVHGYGPYKCPFKYKRSPFYDIQEVLSNTLEFRKLEHNRESLTLNLTLSNATIGRLASDKSLRIVLYCTSEVKYDQPHVAPRDISFPHNIEIRINGEEFKANMKGLKNKPGTTKPADITAFIRTKLPNFTNNITIGYALTKERYFLNVMLVKKKTVQDLTTVLQHGKVISRQQVLDEMKSKASDPDIVAMSTVLSLKDPISYLRLKLPCRSTVCTHIQCFEVSFFLELQEQAPQWSCPICSKPTPFESLAVDEYVIDILRNTSSTTEQVTVEPDGRWKPILEDNTKKPGTYDDDDDDDDDEVLEVVRAKATPVKMEVTPTPGPVPGRNPLGVPPASHLRAQPSSSTGTKRRSEVIDLTLSDDEAPAPKRPAVQSAMPNNMNTFRSSPHTSNGNPTLSPSQTFHPGVSPSQYPANSNHMNGRINTNKFPKDPNQMVSPFSMTNNQYSGGMNSYGQMPNNGRWPMQHPSWARSSSTQSSGSGNGGQR